MRIGAVTGGRADWGLLSMPLAALRADPRFEVVLIATGQHLAPGEDASLAAIVRDGFEVAENVDIAIDDDSAVGIAHSAGLATAGLGRVFGHLRPDLVMLLGDRWEILAAATAALLARIPVVHLCGGDITEGAFDDAIRHAITKLSHIHFVTSEDARARVVQLGEDPGNVHCVGSPGLDRIRATKLMSRAALFDSVGLVPRAKNVLVTYHPATLADDVLGECRAMLVALDALGPDVGILFTGANADPGARGIDGLVGSFVDAHANSKAVRSLGAERYFSALAHVDAVVGNSSSGLYEAPSFGKPAVNIGDRQTGRLKARSVIDCAGKAGAIVEALRGAFTLDCAGVVNPYGDGHASERIVSVLGEVGDPARLLRKRFHNLPIGHEA